MTTALKFAGVHKSFQRLGRKPHKALDGLDLTVDEGGVVGILGPNGSGKTTSIRLLLGLARADAGEVNLLGHTVPRQLPAVVSRVGALVESPIFFPAFSGRRNLALLAIADGVSKTRVEEVLELVGLRERATDAVKGYSLGMRQRLGIAAALLKQPAVLVLDEPSNGLDPAGIREVRELIRQLGEAGTTVVLCSHLLSEVQQVCDRVAILTRGRCVAQGRVSDVLAQRATGEVRIRVPDAAAATAALRAHAFTVGPPEPDGSVPVHGVADAAAITHVLADAGIYLSELTPVAASLESAFLELTAGQALGEQALGEQTGAAS